LIIHILSVKDLARKPVKVKTLHSLNLPISWGVKASGDLLYTSGLVASDPVTGKLIEGDFEAQARRVFDNLNEVLKAAGTSIQNVVKVNIYISDWKDFPTLNQVWTEYFGTDNPPARTTIQVAGFIGGVKLEIELVATK
jgi:2-iminobutanoate/2-iminopropanoate deaminase